MGTDIHLAAEVRRDGVWKYIKTFPEFGDPVFSHDDDPEERFYALFGVLAGVRTMLDGGALFPMRGLPDDIDKGSYCGDDCDCDGSMPDLGDHSQTWASYNELSAIDWDSYEIFESGFRRWVEGRLKNLAGMVGSENVRVLMGFDS